MPRTRSKRARRAPADTASAATTESDGDAYLSRLIAEQIRADVADENPASDVEDNFVDNNGDLSVATVDTSEGGSVSDESNACAEPEVDDTATDECSENEVSGGEPPGEIAIPQVGHDNNNPAPPAGLLEEPVNLDVEDVTDLPKVKDAYVNPGEDAEWSSAAIEITGLCSTDDRIESAKSIDEVWVSFSS